MSVRILVGDCRVRLAGLPSKSVHTCVTSPPYFGLRDYGVDGQIGLEDTPDAFVAQMVEVFREVRRVLRDDGTLWLNLGDSYAGSGRGGNGEVITGAGKDASKVQRGSTLPAGMHANAVEAGAVGRAWVKPPAGLKQKDLIGIPWRVAFALQADGWYLRQDIIWSKPNPMPESVRDRCTKAHEYVFLLSKGPRYYFDAEAISEKAIGQNEHDLTGVRYEMPGQGAHTGSRKNSFARATKDSGGVTGEKPQFRAERELVAYEGKRNKRSVWTVATQPFKQAHFATYPPELIDPCILAGCPAGGTVLDPFGGAGTTGLVADRLQRDAILIELNPEYAALAKRRLEGDAGMFSGVEIASEPQEACS